MSLLQLGADGSSVIEGQDTCETRAPFPSPVEPSRSANPVAPKQQPSCTTLPPGSPGNVGKYEIVGYLGAGGMGVVYKAFDRTLGRTVALKMLKVAQEANSEELKRFSGEAEVLGSLQHPNVVQVFDFGMHEDKPFLVMEFVSGGGLDVRLAGKPQTPRFAAELVETLAGAVHVAHEAGIVHRDLKPANVLLAGDATPKITDFGLAKKLQSGVGLTQTGDVMGTPAYMAPEQARGDKDVGPLADVYSLGAILYECLTGRPPFRAATVLETLQQVLASDPTSPSQLAPRIPRDLSVICLKCLSKSPSRRYASAAELQTDLRNWLDGVRINAREANTVERVWQGVKRRPYQVALAACLLLLIGACAVSFAGWKAVAVAERDRQQSQLLAEAERDRDRAIAEQREQQQESARREQEEGMVAIGGILKLITEGDLRDRSDLGPLYQTLLAYYEQMVERQKDGRFTQRERLADAFYRLAKLYKRTSNLGRAKQALDKAETLFEQGDAEATWLPRALVKQQRGEVLHKLGNRAEAAKEYEQGLSLLEGRAAAGQPGERVWGELQHSKGVLSGELPGQQAEALKHFEKALEVRQRLAEQSKTYENRGDLAQTFSCMGDVQLTYGDLRGADLSYQMAHRIRETLARERQDDEAKVQLARSYDKLAAYQIRGRAFATALGYLEKSREIQGGLVRKQPTNREYVIDFASVLYAIAELRLLAGDKLGDPSAESLVDLQAQAQTLLRTLQEKEKSATFSTGYVAIILLKARLQLQGKLGGDPQGVAVWAPTPLKKLPTSTPESRYQLALALAMQADLEGAKPETSKAALEALKGAFDEGFRRLHPLDVARDQAFRSLAKNAEFQKLIQAQTQRLINEQTLAAK